MRAWLLALSMIATPAAAEVVSADAHSFEIRHRIDTVVPADRLYAAFGDIGGWWSKDHSYSGDTKNLSLTLRAGGCFCERLDQGGGIEHLRVAMVRPGEQVVLTGALGPLLYDAVAAVMNVEITKLGGGSRLTMTYRTSGFASGKGVEMASAVDQMLGQQVKRLRQFAIVRR